MTTLCYLFIFIVGAVVGSFLNVVILRHGAGASIAVGRSRCFNCGKFLKWRELIPIVSFVLQKGKCRECHSRISWQYPIVETIMGIIFVLLFQQSQISNLKSQNIFDFGFWILIFSLLIIIAVYDYYHQIIPDRFVYSFIGLAFMGLIFKNWNLFENWKLQIENSDLMWSVLAGIILFSFFALMWLVSSGRWMGFGDAQLALGIGWFLGVEKGILAIMLSFWIGGIIGVFLLLWSGLGSGRKYGIKSKIAFGPFLVMGALVAFFAGDLFIQIFTPLEVFF